jgi:hypothetical protein
MTAVAKTDPQESRRSNSLVSMAIYSTRPPAKRLTKTPSPGSGLHGAKTGAALPNSRSAPRMSRSWSTRSAYPHMDVKRTGIILKPTRSRVVIRPFEAPNEGRIEKVLARVSSLAEREVECLLEKVMREFRERHQRTREFEARALLLSIDPLAALARTQEQLHGRLPD